MTDLLILRPDKARCFEHIADILTFFALTFGGTNIVFVGGPSRARFSCLAGNMELAGHLTGFDDTLRTGKLPGIITFTRSEKLPAPESGEVPGIKSINTRIIGAIFAVFVDKASDWVKANVSTDYYNWPPVSNFARIVRNAIVHGGTINLKDEEARVAWSGVEISAQNYGDRILNTGKLSLGDLLLLMFNLEEELDGLGAPLDLG
jgi:hypothetical protein